MSGLMTLGNKLAAALGAIAAVVTLLGPGLALYFDANRLQVEVDTQNETIAAQQAILELLEANITASMSSLANITSEYADLNATYAALQANATLLLAQVISLQALEIDLEANISALAILVADLSVQVGNLTDLLLARRFQFPSVEVPWAYLQDAGGELTGNLSLQLNQTEYSVPRTLIYWLNASPVYEPGTWALLSSRLWFGLKWQTHLGQDPEYDTLGIKMTMSEVLWSNASSYYVPQDGSYASFTDCYNYTGTGYARIWYTPFPSGNFSWSVCASNNNATVNIAFAESVDVPGPTHECYIAHSRMMEVFLEAESPNQLRRMNILLLRVLIFNPLFASAISAVLAND